MLVVQALVLLTGSLTTLGVPPAPPKPRTAHASPLHEITAGLPVVARTPKLRSPFILVFCVGLFFVGPFMVCFPLMVRDIYGGDALSLALVLMLFPVGTIIGSLLIRARGGIRRKGLAAILALFGGATALSLISLHLPFAAMLAATLTWGLCGSVFINCSRTLFQEASPSDQRARVLAIYQLGFMGAGPIGALLAGALSAEIGTLGALRAFAAAMFVVVSLVAVTTETRRME
jgi:predicted MFS family arabinose efflux permease